MLNEKVDIAVYGRKMTVEIEGITPLEIHALAKELGDKMRKIERDQDIVDTSKLAILAALEYLAEIQRLKARQDTVKSAEENAYEQMMISLRNAIAAAKK